MPHLLSMLAVALLLAAHSFPAMAQTAPPVCSLDITDAMALMLQMPATEVMSQAFLLGFTMPMTAYLVAYLTGVIVSMFDN